MTDPKSNDGSWLDDLQVVAEAEADETGGELVPVKDALDDDDHQDRPNPHTHSTRLPPDSRGKLNFIVENLNVGITPMTMLLAGKKVEVIAYGIESNGEYLYEPVAIFVDPEIEKALEHLPEPELPPEVGIPDGFEAVILPDGTTAYKPPTQD